jgi:hypothetical protein
LSQPAKGGPGLSAPGKAGKKKDVKENHSMKREFQTTGKAELMPANSLPGFYEGAGECKFEDGETFRLGISFVGAPTLYVFTDRPHPDDQARKQTWVLPLRAHLEAFCQQLHAAGATTPTAPKPVPPVELLDICSMTGAEIYAGYSGRGMYGKQCWGVKCGDELYEVQAEAKNRGLGHGREDRLGLGWIVYWPELAYQPGPSQDFTQDEVSAWMRSQRGEP